MGDFKNVADFYACKCERMEKEYEEKLAEKDKKIAELEHLLGRPSRLKRLREKAMKRDNGKCVKCGSKEQLHLHHKLPILDGGLDTLGNVEMLCKNCHALEHKDSGIYNFIKSSTGWRRTIHDKQS